MYCYAFYVIRISLLTTEPLLLQRSNIEIDIEQTWF